MICRFLRRLCRADPVQKSTAIEDDTLPPSYAKATSGNDAKPRPMKADHPQDLSEKAISKAHKSHDTLAAVASIDKQLSKARDEAIMRSICSASAVEDVCDDVLSEFRTALQSVLDPFVRQQDVYETWPMVRRHDISRYPTAFRRISANASRQAMLSRTENSTSELGYHLVSAFFQSLALTAGNSELRRNQENNKTNVNEPQLATVDSCNVRGVSDAGTGHNSDAGQPYDVSTAKEPEDAAIHARDRVVAHEVSSAAAAARACEDFMAVFKPALQEILSEAGEIQRSCGQWSSLWPGDTTGYATAYRVVAEVARLVYLDWDGEQQGQPPHAYWFVGCVYHDLAVETILRHSCATVLAKSTAAADR